MCPTHSHRCTCSALKRARVRGPVSRWFLTQLHERVGKRKISAAAYTSHGGCFQVSFQTGVGNYRWALEQTRLKENLVRERYKCATLGSHWTGEKVWAGFTPWFTTKVTGLDLFGCVWEGLGFPGNLPAPKTHNQINRGGEKNKLYCVYSYVNDQGLIHLNDMQALSFGQEIINNWTDLNNNRRKWKRSTL